ncbi:MAG TPA: enoyl-CoA hydratase-related protein [Acidimicrobiales bacterium]|jgi:enoyl-CoA hydratase/carnithine racemase|nr:enoyl-CoA hydratase-related protein [Acidimicrobiales bacterium]
MSAGPYEVLLVEVDAGVAVVTLNRPEQLNAFTPRMGLELGHALVTLDADESVRAIVLTGAGRAFCAGAALDPASSTFNGVNNEPDLPGPPMSSLSPWTMATPILGAINGHAVGLGLTYAMQCDIRIVAEEAKLGFVFTRRGVLPEANSLWSLSRAIGTSRSLELLLTGRTFSGTEAAELGLASRALPAAEVLPATLDIARDIAANTAPESVALTKQLFYEFLTTGDRDAARAEEREAFQYLVGRPDGTEGSLSFLERRAPQWSGSKHVNREEIR